MRDLVDGDVGRYVLERAHPGSVLEALRRVLEPLEALPIDGVDLGVRRPDFLRVVCEDESNRVEDNQTPRAHRGLRVVGVLLRADLIEAIVVLVARLASANSTHQLHELALRRADAVARPQMDVDELRGPPRHRLEGVAAIREVDLFRMRILRDVLRVKEPVI